MNEQRLYLARHGETLENRLQFADESSRPTKATTDLKQLTPEGRQQALVLGDYFSVFLLKFMSIKPADLCILTSAEDRSIETGEIVGKRLRVPAYNFYSSIMLNEQTPREYMAKLVGGTEGVDILDRFRPVGKIAEMVEMELRHHMKRNPGKTLIAPLHGNINLAFLRSIGADIDYFENCAMIPLAYEEGKFKQQGDYITVHEMKQELSEILESGQ